MKLYAILVCARMLSRREGFTLPEVIVAVGIFVAVATVFSMITFPILSLQGDWRPELIATRDLRHAGSLFATDALNAQTTTLASLANATSTVTLEWMGVGGVTSTVKYGLSGDASPYQLVREHGGVERQLATNVVSLGFSLAGRVLTMDLQVQVGEDTIRSRTLRTYLRNLP